MAIIYLPPPPSPLPFLSHATVLELAWTALAAVGTGYAIRNLWEAHGDLRVQEETPAPSMARLVMASGNVRREGVSVFLLSTLLFLGVLGIIAPSRPPAASGAIVALWVTPLLALSWEAVIVWSSWKNNQQRQKIRRLVQRDVMEEYARQITAAAAEAAARAEVAAREAATRSARVEGLITENTELTKEAVAHAEEAYKEANNVNLAIKRLGLGLKDVQERQERGQGQEKKAP